VTVAQVADSLFARAHPPGNHSAENGRDPMQIIPRHRPTSTFAVHRRSNFIRLGVWTLILSAFGAALTRQAQCADSAAPQIQRVSVGFQGNYKSGFWNLVRAEVTGGEHDEERDLAITVLDGDGIPVRHDWSGEAAIKIPAHGAHTIERYVKFGRHNRQMTVTLTDPKHDAAPSVVHVELANPLKSDRELILSWGPPVGLDETSDRRIRSASESAVVCQLKGAGELPNAALGFDAVNCLVLTTSDAQMLDQISSQQIAALREWVLQGGRLVLCVGARGDAVLGPSGKWAEFAPGAFQQVAILRNSSPLETYGGSAQRLTVAPPAEGISMTWLRNVHGQIELFDLAPGGQRPMIVRAPFGFGQVVFAAFDLDQPPFVGWEGRPRFVHRLLHESQNGAEGNEAYTASNQRVQFGYKDMSGQLRSALDQFPGVTSVAFSWVAALALVYVLLIGPADYFLLHDALKRMHWTWVTFPIFVGAFVILAVALNHSLKGSRIRANHLDLVDVDVASGTVRGTTWSHIYAPQAAMYDVAIQPRSDDAAKSSDYKTLVAWHGLPGTALGGLDGGPALQTGTNTEYRLKFSSPESASILGIPIAVASTQSFLTRWNSQVPRELQTKLVKDADGLLRGQIVNPLDVELHDCAVLFDNWVYRLDSRRGMLSPGQRTPVEAEQALNLQWRLSGRRVVDSKDFGTPWDQNTLDIHKILEMMMLHSAAGGESYTQLANRYQVYVDLSQHLKSGRAILVGRARTSATKMTLNGTPLSESDEQHWTYYRVVFPVDAERD
jgi:hypothetical protein